MDGECQHDKSYNGFCNIQDLNIVVKVPVRHHNKSFIPLQFVIDAYNDILIIFNYCFTKHGKLIVY